MPPEMPRPPVATTRVTSYGSAVVAVAVSDTMVWAITGSGLYRTIVGGDTLKILFDPANGDVGGRELAVFGTTVALIDSQHRLVVSKDGGETFAIGEVPNGGADLSGLTAAHERAYAVRRRTDPDRFELVHLAANGVVTIVPGRFAGYPLPNPHGELEILSYGESGTALVRVAPAGTTTDILTQGADIEFGARVGRYVYAVEYRSDSDSSFNNTRLIRLPTEGADLTPVADWNADKSYALTVFSASTNRIAFNAEPRGDRSTFYEFHVNTPSDVHALTVEGGVVAARFSPNGTLVALGRNGTVYVRPQGASELSPLFPPSTP
jgi:hypothetical protein